MTRPDSLIKARQARADDTRRRADKALAAMVRSREPVTFSAVASRAGVSREYLYRTPDLAANIRNARASRAGELREASESGSPSIIAALRDHIRRLEATHHTEIANFRRENQDLQRQLAAALGQLIGEQPR